MAPQLYICLLALVFLRATAEPECKNLVKPLVLDSHSPIYGRWVLSVASWDKDELKDDLFSVKASLVELSAHPDNEHLTVFWADRMRKDDTCLQGLTNATISGMTAHTTFNINGHTSYHDGKYYETCADCLLSEDTTLLPDGNSKGRYLFLFTRTGKLEPSELETFKKQAACLKFPPEYYFGTDELCPDERKTETSAAESNPTTTQAPTMYTN
ncbi:saxitoxin and tetrodotoxin-binding protein 1-like [Eucyclogobius newberryi]|uniref:saxitoxin and tetrodotoxin-binding protein 1-like n=1 Tax=Eucyclogobius newberryi TaxID=166745 RepID=UPI003B597F5B